MTASPTVDAWQDLWRPVRDEVPQGAMGYEYGCFRLLIGRNWASVTERNSARYVGVEWHADGRAVGTISRRQDWPRLHWLVSRVAGLDPTAIRVACEPAVPVIADLLRVCAGMRVDLTPPPLAELEDRIVALTEEWLSRVWHQFLAQYTEDIADCECGVVYPRRWYEGRCGDCGRRVCVSCLVDAGRHTRVCSACAMRQAAEGHRA